MKKYFFSMVALLILGAIVFGAGYVLYDRSDNKVFGQYLEYSETEYAVQGEIEAIDFTLIGDYNIILQRGEISSLSYSQSEISDITVTEENGVLTLNEKIDWKKQVKKWYCRRQKTDLILTLPEENKITVKCNFASNVSIALPDWEFGDIDLKISGKTDVSSNSLKAGDVNLDVSGFASVNLNGEFQNVFIKTSGMSEIELNGSANAIDIKSSGTMSFDSEDIICPRIDVKASGTAKMNIVGEGDSLS
ncbi:MAG: DUF2807 domain-containing protein, partial [Clostridia bacterium]|nr:DUF2807 domain-containing protein [Clostridia bacterium]